MPPGLSYLIRTILVLGVVSCSIVLLFSARYITKRGDRKRAEAAMEAGRHQEAIRSLESILKSEPENVWALISLASEKAAAGDDRGALASWDAAIVRRPDIAMLYTSRGRSKFQLGEYAEAQRDFSRTIELAPAKFEPYLERGLVRVQLRQLPEAEADFRKVVELAPKKPFGHAARGLAHRMLGDDEASLADYAEALKLDPSMISVHGNRGVIYSFQQNWTAALQEFDAELEQSHSREYAALWSTALRVKLGQTEKGREVLRKQLDSRPAETASDWFSKIAAYLLGDLDEAGLLAAAKSPDANKTTQQLCEANYFIGMVRLGAGDTQGARAAFQASIDTDIRNFVEYELAAEELKHLPAS